MLTKRIDSKHHIECIGDVTGMFQGCQPSFKIQLVKTSNNQPIPDGEPVILFRGRDRLALPMLYAYRDLCVADGYNDHQLDSLDGVIAEFVQFAATSSTMKQPGITRGL